MFWRWWQPKGCPQWACNTQRVSTMYIASSRVVFVTCLVASSLREMPEHEDRATGATTFKSQIKSCIKKGGTCSGCPWQLLQCVYSLWKGYQPNWWHYLRLFISHLLSHFHFAMFQPELLLEYKQDNFQLHCSKAPAPCEFYNTCLCIMVGKNSHLRPSLKNCCGLG